MIFTPLALSGTFRIDLEPRSDERGSFARAFCAEEFARAGLVPSFVQANVSTNYAKGTLRGMHYQLPPAAETKVVRCIRGALFDVIVDLRPESATFGKWHGEQLDAHTPRMLYVPEGFAHGFLSLEDDTEVLYFVSAMYAPALERGLRYDDPFAGISWPAGPQVISAKDAAWPTFDRKRHLADLGNIVA